MQERFDDTAQFLSRPHHAESNDQRIDDILLYDASVPVKVDPGVSRPTTTSILQPITSNLAIIRPHTGQRPSTGAHTRSGNAVEWSLMLEHRTAIISEGISLRNTITRLICAERGEGDTHHGLQLQSQNSALVGKNKWASLIA